MLSGNQEARKPQRGIDDHKRPSMSHKVMKEVRNVFPTCFISPNCSVLDDLRFYGTNVRQLELKSRWRITIRFYVKNHWNDTFAEMLSGFKVLEQALKEERALASSEQVSR